MKYLGKVLTLGILPLLLLLLGLFGVTKVINQNSSSDIIHLTEVQDHSSQSKKVSVDGKVTKIIPLVESVAYEIQDKTGKIWVISNNKPPEINQQLTVDGVLQYQEITIGEEDFGDFYILESQKTLI